MTSCHNNNKCGLVGKRHKVQNSHAALENDRSCSCSDFVFVFIQQDFISAHQTFMSLWNVQKGMESKADMT
ncbi:hypothetical protein XELAEV_18039595mg [Xenopus laevis]|uniref:Uncharacterized protein n=1 Tax=Xenopus laevis TaxID=8355 RepID=A0A974H8H5_XENLA|nr:hypothetical protein XELAEV_18039595mg [Xenopus laevis]